MGEVKIDESLCKGCELCTLSCPHDCLVMGGRISKKGFVLVEFKNPDNKCNGCTMCAVVCPDLALTVYK